MDLEKAQKIIKNVVAKAEEMKVKVSVAVVDEYGDLVAFERMDGALKISPRFALAKANTSASLGMPTSGLAEYAVTGKPYYGLNSIFSGELTTIAGGVPVKNGEKVIGAVGVGGSYDVKQDEECAMAGVEG
jgi:uncharacterized protein GlcG (DUF336 family)